MGAKTIVENADAGIGIEGHRDTLVMADAINSIIWGFLTHAPTMQILLQWVMVLEPLAAHRLTTPPCNMDAPPRTLSVSSLIRQ